MANTERLAALRALRGARNMLNVERLRPGLSQATQLLLTKAFVDLDDLENRLILDEIQSNLDVIAREAKDLRGITDEMKAAADDLGNLVAAIGKAADVVDGLVRVAGFLVEAGVVG